MAVQRSKAAWGSLKSHAQDAATRVSDFLVDAFNTLEGKVRLPRTPSGTVAPPAGIALHGKPATASQAKLAAKPVQKASTRAGEDAFEDEIPGYINPAAGSRGVLVPAKDAAYNDEFPAAAESKHVPEEIQWLAAQAAESLNRVASLAALAASTAAQDLAAAFDRAHQVAELADAVEATAAESNSKLAGMTAAAKAAEAMLHEAMTASDAAGTSADGADRTISRSSSTRSSTSSKVAQAEADVEAEAEAEAEAESGSKPKSVADLVMDFLADKAQDSAAARGSSKASKAASSSKLQARVAAGDAVDESNYDADLNLYAEYDDDDDDSEAEVDQQLQEVDQQLQDGKDKAFEAALAALERSTAHGTSRGEAAAITERYAAQQREAERSKQRKRAASSDAEDDEGPVYTDDSDYMDYSDSKQEAKEGGKAAGKAEEEDGYSDDDEGDKLYDSLRPLPEIEEQRAAAAGEVPHALVPPAIGTVMRR